VESKSCELGHCLVRHIGARAKDFEEEFAVAERNLVEYFISRRIGVILFVLDAESFVQHASYSHQNGSWAVPRHSVLDIRLKVWSICWRILHVLSTFPPPAQMRAHALPPEELQPQPERDVTDGGGGRQIYLGNLFLNCLAIR
jgi:hypothetical protein